MNCRIYGNLLEFETGAISISSIVGAYVKKLPTQGVIKSGAYSIVTTYQLTVLTCGASVDVCVSESKKDLCDLAFDIMDEAEASR